MMKKRQQLNQLLFKIVILDALAAVAPQSKSFQAASPGARPMPRSMRPGYIA